jgi:hypothetical protein
MPRTKARDDCDHDDQVLPMFDKVRFMERLTSLEAIRMRIPPSFLISIERDNQALRKTVPFDLPKTPKKQKTLSHIDIPDFSIVDRRQVLRESRKVVMEDLSDEAFENHHRKYEREEKRLKNREVEIFKHEQYKRRELALEQWQKEASHRIVIGTAYRPSEEELGIWTPTTPTIPLPEEKKRARTQDKSPRPSPRPVRTKKTVTTFAQEFYGPRPVVDEDETEEDARESDDDVLEHFTRRYKKTVLSPVPNRKRSLRLRK